MIQACLRVILSGLLGALPGCFAQAAEGRAFVVRRPVVNLHSGPRADADVVSQALLGARLVELEGRGGWVRIQAEDGYKGWVARTALRPLKSAERYPASLDPGKALAVDALGANLYREPDVKQHAPVMTVPYGVLLERAEGGKEPPKWMQARLPDRRVVWIQAGDVRTELAPLSMEASLALAKRFLGVNYTWGGSSSFGFDCSGFTQTIVRSRGPIMPRDASVQATWSGSAEVKDRAQLKPGDLLYFSENGARVTHTGIYLGEGSFIHDSTSGHPCVQISALGEAYWSKHLVAMRRVK